MHHRLTTFEDLHVGQQASFSKTITEADISHFVAITGDVNPLHVDREFAARTFFGQRVVQGLLSASLLSTVIGMLLPGTGAIYRSQTLEFLRPVYIGDTLTACCEILEIDREKELIRMDAKIDRQDGETVIRGSSEASLLRGIDD